MRVTLSQISNGYLRGAQCGLQTLPETIFSQSDLGLDYRAEDIPKYIHVL